MTEPRTIAVLTTGRQDWGILASSAGAIRDHPALRLRLLVGGMHLAHRYGHTVDEVVADGFVPDARLAWLDGDEPAEATEVAADAQAGAALGAIGAHLRATPPDALLLAGDRFETAAAAIAATVNRVPIVHLHGGEQTGGAFDDALRHAITKLSHLHLVSHPEHAARVVAMGEDPAAVHVVGAPGLDAAFRDDLPDRDALAAHLGLALDPPVVVVTVHPETLAPDPVAAAEAVRAAIDQVAATYVVTLPNADPARDRVAAVMGAAGAGPRRIAVAALGSRWYWSLLRAADALLGNSSSAIVEAPALGVPAVDVGDRQAGRHRDANVVHAAADPEAVVAALRRALEPSFRAAVSDVRPALADGRAGHRVAAIIAAWVPPQPPRKPFIAVGPAAGGRA